MRNTWIELPQICALRCCVGLLRWVLNRLPLERHRRSPQQEDQERKKSLQPKKPICIKSVVKNARWRQDNTNILSHRHSHAKSLSVQNHFLLEEKQTSDVKKKILVDPKAIPRVSIFLVKHEKYTSAPSLVENAEVWWRVGWETDRRVWIRASTESWASHLPLTEYLPMHYK